MKDDIYGKVKKHIDAWDMISAGDLVAAGVSGGADSVCLLHILWRLRKERPFRLAAVHVNHGLRKEAGEDAAFVGRLCAEWEIPFILREADVAGYAALHKVSTEEAGRLLRYQILEEALAGPEYAGPGLKTQTPPEAAAGCGRRRIAVAHNAQDRAETMLFHLFRGSGLKGLSSIRPVREAVIRPLLPLDREEIEAYLTAQGLSWQEDSTNGEDAYARNRIRHHILPFAEREICSGAVAHMGELADILAETEDYLSRETEKLYESCIREPHKEKAFFQAAGQNRELALCLNRLKETDRVMQKRVLLRALETVVPYRKDIGLRHIEGLLSLMEKSGSGSLSLPGGIRACKEYDALTFRRVADNTPTPPGSFSFILWKREAIPEDSLFYKKEQNIPENRYTKWFDYDKITTSLLLRPRREGDYLTIDDAFHTQSLRRYMINGKIPREKRDDLCVLADGSHVLWIPGYRTSTAYRVREDTERVLEVRLENTEGENNGGENRGTVDGGTGG